MPPFVRSVHINKGSVKKALRWGGIVKSLCKKEFWPDITPHTNNINPTVRITRPCMTAHFIYAYIGYILDRLSMPVTVSLLFLAVTIKTSF